MDEHEGHYIKWNNPVTERYSHSYVEFKKVGWIGVECGIMVIRDPVGDKGWNKVGYRKIVGINYCTSVQVQWLQLTWCFVYFKINRILNAEILP
jgi:hypothetical protein